MANSYVRRVVWEYALHLVRAAPRRSGVIRAVEDWLGRMAEVGLVPLARRGEVPPPPASGESSPEERVSRISSFLARRLKERRGLKPSLLQKNLDAFGEEVGLDALEVAILGLAVRHHTESSLSALCEALEHEAKLKPSQAVASLLGAPLAEVARRTRLEGTLAATGILSFEMAHGPYQVGIGTTVSTPFLEAVLPPSRGAAAIRRRLLGAPCRADLGWEDFDHVRRERDLAAGLLEGAVRRRTRGVNVLLYGPVGTGKTELCKVVAARLGLRLYAVGEADEAGEEPTRRDRLGAYRLAQRLLERRPGAALLFDEMEDLLDESASLQTRYERSGSKAFINRLLETNPVPTLWTTNSLEALGSSVVRRMSLAVRLMVPPPAIRERVWRRHLRRRRLRVPGAEVAALAREVEVAPGVVAKAVQAAQLAGGDRGHLRRTATSLAQALLGRPPLPQPGPPYGRFDASLIAADADVPGLIRALTREGAPRGFSLCLHGPPGTGKSALVRHLADGMGLEVLQKRASDLLSMWVGETERRIALAFEEAREEGRFLVFDEADSLLGDRALAGPSWEVAQVNEMLTWMEGHPLPFACTTNLMERLDPASLRRFTFKVRLDFLGPAQARRAFALYFETEPPRDLDRLRTLTPGDFAAVRRKAELLGALGDGGALVKMLGQECALKPGRARAISFA